MAIATATPGLGLTPTAISSIFETLTPLTEHAQEFRRVANEICVGVFSAKTWSADLAFSEVARQIIGYLSLSPGWDSYAAQPPSDRAVNVALVGIELMRKIFLTPPHVVPANEGGIAAAFSGRDRLAQIEFLNSGTVYTTTYSATETPQVTRFDSDERSLSNAIATLRDFLFK